MKKKSTIVLLFFALQCFAQQETDSLDIEKITLAKIAIEKYSDCPAAEKSLSQVSVNSQQNSLFIYYSALTAECLGKFQEAINHYTKYKGFKNSSQLEEKIVELKYLLAKQEEKRIANCRKCDGTGKYEKKDKCKKGCEFFFTLDDSRWTSETSFIMTNIKCNNCNGTGYYTLDCWDCGGKGETEEWVHNTRFSRPCKTCRGDGKIGQSCSWGTRFDGIKHKCKDGYFAKQCPDCEGEGYTYKTLTCDHK